MIEKALCEARKAATLDEVPVGAVFVLNGKIIARGHNLREKKQSILAHAELVAMVRANRKLKSWRLLECDVYVTLEPCPMCTAALQQARVRHVYYGAPDPKAGAVSLGLRLHDNSRLNHRFQMTCLDNSECGKILSRFFIQARRAKKKER
jgi:tRNA(adenine34) deaminase